MIDPSIFLKLIPSVLEGVFLSLAFGISYVILRKKYKAKVEYILAKFFSKILRKEIDFPLLIDQEEIMKLEYSQYSRELWLNAKSRKRLIITPQYDSEPEKLIKYLIENPNRNIQFKELIEKVSLSDKSSLSKLVSDLRFTGNLRNLFFHVSKTSIYLTNPITSLQLRQSKFKLEEILS